MQGRGRDRDRDHDREQRFFNIESLPMSWLKSVYVAINAPSVKLHRSSYNTKCD